LKESSNPRDPKDSLKITATNLRAPDLKFLRYARESMNVVFTIYRIFTANHRRCQRIRRVEGDE